MTDRARAPGRLVLLAAGGTGGHLFPAESLAVALRRLGVRVVLASDGRTAEIARTFPADEVVRVRSATPSGRSLLRKAVATLHLGRGYVGSLALMRRLRPDCVVGFGGYPTVPPLAAAATLGIPTVIHEQNGVVGRANRFLMRRVRAVATGFKAVAGLPDGLAARTFHTGNPIRPAVLAAARRPFEAPAPGGPFRLLAFGGSQGARVMSEIVPAALALLPAELRARLDLVQQARSEDIAAVRDACAATGIRAVVEPFFTDLPARIAAAHLVVARSGASTVAELAAIGRPSILVPLPGAIDQDQAANARSLAAIGAATVIPQPDFTAERLAGEIASAMADPARLTEAARAAKSAGITDAAERLAALVLSLGGIAVPEPRLEETPA